MICGCAAAALAALALGGCYLDHEEPTSSDEAPEAPSSVPDLAELDADPDFADVAQGLAAPPAAGPGCGAPSYGRLETEYHYAANDPSVTTVGDGFFASYKHTPNWADSAGPLRGDARGFVPGAPRRIPPVFPYINPWEGGTMMEGPRGTVGACRRAGGRFDGDEIGVDGLFVLNAGGEVIATGDTRGRCRNLAWIEGFWATITLLSPGRDLIVEYFDEALNKVGETSLEPIMQNRSSQSIVGFGDRFVIALLDEDRLTAHLSRLDPNTGDIELERETTIATRRSTAHYWLKLSVSGDRLGFFYSPATRLTFQSLDADLNDVGDPLEFWRFRVGGWRPFFIDAQPLGNGWAVTFVPEPYGLVVALVDPDAGVVTPIDLTLGDLERWSSWTDLAVQGDVVLVGFSTLDEGCDSTLCGNRPHMLRMRCSL